jgi:surface protein
MLKNIKSGYILKNIIHLHLNKRKYYLLAKHNKYLLKRLDLTLEDYIKLYKTIEIEIIPLPVSEIENTYTYQNYYFIKRKENKSIFHIYFNDDRTEVKRNYITKDDGDKIKKIKIEIDPELKSLKELFSDCVCIKEIKFTKFKREDFTDLNGMFYGCAFLDKLDITQMKTPNVTDMSHLFNQCHSLPELDIRNFDTSKVKNMAGMFSCCIKLKKINFNFNTKNVKSFKCMFNKCLSLKELNISSFDFSNGDDFAKMFFLCINLNYLDLTVFKVPHVKYLAYSMFGKCQEKLQTKVKKELGLEGDDGFEKINGDEFN